jgi:hypothetical protein
MKSILPSKKFIYIILSIVIALGVIFIFSWIKDLKKTSVQTKIVAETLNNTKQKEFLALDTDGDGLKDWEEALWKTDPNNPDTDGDGTNDFDEIKAGRDPLKPNTAKPGEEPNDIIPDEIIKAEKKMVDDFQKLPTADKVARMLMSQVVAVTKVGQTPSQAELNYIVSNTLNQIPEIAFEPYLLADISILPNTTNENVKQYANDLAKNFLENPYFSKQIKNKSFDIYGLAEVNTLVMAVMEDQKTEKSKLALSELSSITKSYFSLIINLLKIKVPKDLALDHLDLVNAFSSVYNDLSILERDSNDIFIVFSFMNSYIDNNSIIIDATINLAKKIAETGINFDNTDLAYQLILMLQ